MLLIIGKFRSEFITKEIEKLVLGLSYRGQYTPIVKGPIYAIPIVKDAYIMLILMFHGLKQILDNNVFLGS